jgi:hypothetical protein
MRTRPTPTPGLPRCRLCNLVLINFHQFRMLHYFAPEGALNPKYPFLPPQADIPRTLEIVDLHGDM